MKSRTGTSIAARTWLGLTLALLALPAMAQDKYPSRPLTIIIPFGAGSSSDVGVRLMASKMQPRFGQPILVEAKPGAGATIGPAVTARAKPDGYTIMYGTTSGLATAAGMVKNLTYDPIKDFAGITLIGEQFFALLARGEYKGLSFPQFLERMRKEPDKFPIGGQSGTYQALNNLMRDAAKLKHEWIPYPEAGRMMNDLWGERLGAALVPLNLALPTLKSGQGYIVAVASTVRTAILPDTPTMDETLPGVSVGSWTGYFAPAKVPRAIITTLHQHITTVGKDPDVLRRNSEGGRPLFLTPEETDAYVRKEVPRWTRLLKEAGIEPQ